MLTVKSGRYFFSNKIKRQISPLQKAKTLSRAALVNDEPKANGECPAESRRTRDNDRCPRRRGRARQPKGLDPR